MGRNQLVPETINPSESPYLHIKRAADGSYDYVASIGRTGIVSICNAEVTESGLVVGYRKFESMTLELLPEISETPPPSFDAAEQVQKAIHDLVREQGFFEIVNAYTGEANLVAIEHGVQWGLAPERWLAYFMRVEGYDVNASIGHLGGKNRIKTHGFTFTVR